VADELAKMPSGARVHMQDKCQIMDFSVGQIERKFGWRVKGWR